MSPKTPAPDAAEFADRLSKILENLGLTRSEFARRAGIVQNTFNTYFHGTEPDRPTIRKIAQAAGVAAGYIVDGTAPAPAMAQAPTGPDFDLSLWRKNLRHYVAKDTIWRRDLIKATGLTLERLSELSQERDPTVSDIIAIARYLNVAKLVSEDYAAADKLPPELSDPREGKSSLLPQVHADTAVVFSRHDFEVLERMNSEMIKELGRGGIELLRQPDEAMEPALRKGDFAIALSGTEIVSPGLYMLSNPKRTFIMRAHITPDDTILLNFDNPRYQSFGPTKFDPQQHTVFGRVVFRLIRETKAE